MRSERIEARVEPEQVERIRYAADLERMSMSAFVVGAAAEKAERVIAEHRETVVPSDFYDEMLATLDRQAPSKALRKAAAKAKRVVRAR